MGVPSLYRWLTQKYPEIKLKLNSSSNYNIDNLYLDFNAVIHPCCDKTLDSGELTDSTLYNNLSDFLDCIISKIVPKKLLYIAVDGVAPRAKLNQQRSRRFITAKEHEECGKIYFNDPEQDDVEMGFDVNAITPGTEFMERLDIYIQELISFKMSTDERWKFNVIYSNYKVPGEGEQKIMHYIRNCQNPQFNSMIFSPDGDVIFLGLSLFDYNILILRDEPKNGFEAQIIPEKMFPKEEYSVVDVNLLRNLLIKEFKLIIKIPFDHRRFLEDWILLCFSVGNDFLPSSPCFEIRTNALDKLTNILKILYMKTKSYITNSGKINFEILRQFFAECAIRENQYIQEKRTNLYNTRQRMNLPFDTAEEFSIVDDMGKIKFYVEKMNIKCEDDLDIACAEYIKGWEWVYHYYFYENISWDWYYPYHFAPFFTDLSKVNMKKFRGLEAHVVLGKPLKPMEQLLAVLPPKSRNLLPKTLQDTFDKYSEMYPMNFKIDMFQKCMDWQAEAILPFIKIENIKSAYESSQSTLTFAECERNIAAFPIFYSKQQYYIAKIHNLYSNLLASDDIELYGVHFRMFTINKIDYINTEINSEKFRFYNKTVKASFDQRKPFKRSFKI